MNIGIISDIHGGLHELNLALDHLQKAQVDQIVCAGDLVDFGDYGEEVVNRIIELEIPCVQGNHDQSARGNQRKSQREGGIKRSILPAKTLDALESLPLELRFTWADTTLLLAHATSWGGDMYIYPDSNPPLLRRVVREANADVTILGHTHRPMWIQIDDKMIINTGSLSQNYELGFGTYGILSLPERQFQLFNLETGAQVPVSKKSY